MVNSTKVVTGKVRFSYVNLFEPKAFDENQVAKYSVTLIIPKTDVGTIQRMKDAIQAAAEKGKSTKFGGKIPPVLKSTLKDADKDTNNDGEILATLDENLKNCYVLRVSSTTKPGVVDANLNPIIDPTEIYSGCYGRASVNFFAYNSNGNKGISAGLGNVQKLEDGEPLGSVSTPEHDFS